MHTPQVVTIPKMFIIVHNINLIIIKEQYKKAKNQNDQHISSGTAGQWICTSEHLKRKGKLKKNLNGSDIL